MDQFLLRVLLVDDDKAMRQSVTATLKGWGCEVVQASTAAEAMDLLAFEPSDLVLTDALFAVELSRGVKTIRPSPVVAVIASDIAEGDVESALREGAFDVIQKPFMDSQLAHLLRKVQTVAALTRENEQLRRSGRRADYFTGLTSPAMGRLKEFIQKIAMSDVTVLLAGESGTGKNEIAKLIHERSARAHRPFVMLNCTSLTESVLEAELFGYVKGAFQGVVQNKVGKLETAHRGTLMLDEVGELSLSAQAKLLRFLKENVVERLGSQKPIEVDVRLIATTNRNLADAVATGKFRDDLYYQLNVFECTLVPLRHRKEDLPVVIRKLMADLAGARSGAQPKEIPGEVMKLLVEHSWPGNIRELRNTLERLLLLSSGREITLDDLPDSVRPQPRAVGHAPLASLEQVEKEHIRRVLTAEQKLERAAEILGITTAALSRKRKEYGLL